MKVTAVVVTYQSREYIDECLRALRESQQAGVLECVVVDNASTDGTADHVETSHPWVQVVRNSRNLGYGRGCNVGLERSTSEYVLFMNPDAVVRLEGLRELVQFLEGRSQAGIVAPATILGKDKLQGARALPTPRRIMRAACTSRWSANSVRLIEPGSGPFQADWLCGAVLLARRSLIEELGGFDPRFFLYFEETDLCRRALDSGSELWAVGTAVAHHSGGASTARSRECVVDGCIRHHFYRSRFYYLCKHHGWLAAIFTELAELLVLTMCDAGRLVLGRRSQRLRARLRSPILRLPASDP